MNRGGSWNNNANNSRSANRNNNSPDNRNNNIGFRLVSTAKSEAMHVQGYVSCAQGLSSVQSSAGFAGQTIAMTGCLVAIAKATPFF